MGLDAFLEIDTWKSYRDLFLLIPFIVMTRPGLGLDTQTNNRRAIEEYLKSEISEDYRFLMSTACCIHPVKQPIFLIDIKPIDISSTKVRECVKRGLSIDSLVPKTVADFIKTKGLYL